MRIIQTSFLFPRPAGCDKTRSGESALPQSFEVLKRWLTWCFVKSWKWGQGDMRVIVLTFIFWSGFDLIWLVKELMSYIYKEGSVKEVIDYPSFHTWETLLAQSGPGHRVSPWWSWLWSFVPVVCELFHSDALMSRGQCSISREWRYIFLRLILPTIWLLAAGKLMPYARVIATTDLIYSNFCLIPDWLPPPPLVAALDTQHQELVWSKNPNSNNGKSIVPTIMHYTISSFIARGLYLQNPLGNAMPRCDHTHQPTACNYTQPALQSVTAQPNL